MATTDIKIVKNAPNRETESVSTKELFGVGNDTNKVDRFIEPGPFTPEIDLTYKFDPTNTVFGLLALACGDNCYLVGHSGTGKTTWVEQVAARLNYNVVRVGFDGHMLRADLMGAYKLRAGETSFEYGLIPQAFQLPGTILLLDEVDACAPETAFAMQSALSESRRLYMTETNEVIPLHPQNAIMATANTTGQGDDSRLYDAGTNVQNFSFLNRFKTTMKFDYLPFDTEVEMLKDRFSACPDDTVKAVASVLRESRSAFAKGTLSRPLTTRDGINWLRKITRISAPMYSASYAFLNQLHEREANTLAEYISSVFKISENDDPRYSSRTKATV